MDTKRRILNCLEQVGIVFDVNDMSSDIEMADFLTDSIVFIQFIVAIEEEFGIDFPDEYLIIDKLGSLSALTLTIESLV